MITGPLEQGLRLPVRPVSEIVNFRSSRFQLLHNFAKAPADIKQMRQPVTAAPAQTLTTRDTPTRYGHVTRLLHWAMAALILWQLAGMVAKVTLGKTPLVSFMTGTHQPVGTILLVLIVVRVIWAVMNRGNRPAHGTGTAGQAARLGHFALYALMLIIPASAVLRSWGNDRSFAPFGFEIFSAKEVEVEWAVAIGNVLHGELGWALLVLVLGHIGMVAVHRHLWRDNTLEKMTGR